MFSSFPRMRNVFGVICCVCALTVFIVYKFDLKEIPIFTQVSTSPPIKFDTSDDSNLALFTKMLIWVSPTRPPSQGSLGRIKILMEQLNEDNGAICQKFQPASDTPITCQFSLDPKQVEDADAVGFYMFNAGYGKIDVPQTRTPDQIWISFVQESPAHSGWVDSLKNLFNWTMSYRRDSELWAPYGRKLQKPEDTKNSEPIMYANLTLDKWIAGKSKLVAGVISHCKTSSKRELLIEKMNETEGLVDVYGSCGNKPMCGLVNNYNRKCDDFWLDFARDYKFFLAYENSLCMDYITEKFWRTLEIGVVPVVYGGGDYTREAPPYSFINARDFKKPKDLMDYLKILDKNDTEYAKYFEWKKEYEIEEKFTWHRAWCSACHAVSNHKNGKTRLDNVYPNLKDWWRYQPNSNQSACEKTPKYD